MFPGMICFRLLWHTVMKILAVVAIFISGVSSQKCADTLTAGSLERNDNFIITPDQTFILANSTISCSATVVAWEFCYRTTGIPSVTFYPGIWRITETSSSNNYTLVQINDITFPPIADMGDNVCQRVNISESNQFIAPARSVVGLYSNMPPSRALLLHSNDNSTLTTYQSGGNQSRINNNNSIVNYNIAIRVHLVPISDTTTVTPTTSIVSTSDTTTIPPTTSIVSTSDTTTVPLTTTSIVSTSDTTTVPPTTSIVPINDATTVTPTTSIVPTSDTTAAFPTTSPSNTTTNTTTATSTSRASTRVSGTTKVDPTRTTDAKSSSDNGGSSSIGIIVGAVVGVILCIIVILAVVILLWCYSKQRKDTPQVTQNFELIADKCDLSQESTAINDSNYYSMIQNQPNVKYSGKIGDKNVASEAPSYKNIKVSNDMSLNSKDSTGKSHSRFACIDYEAAPNLAGYGTAIQLYSNTTRTSTTYNNSIISEYSEITDATDEEEIYSDPGHSKEDIYACFEKKKFRMIKRNDVSILQTLGSGEFGVVNLGLWSNVCADPVQVAVKTLNSQCSESDRVKFLREAAIMGQFKHNNVVQLHGVVFEEENVMIILEYMPKGDLREFLIDLKNTTPPETFNELKHDLLSYCRHVSAGLSHLASKGFVHRDLAARNILVSSDDVCKIADFGMARDVTDDTYYVSSGGKIPVKWTAPEAIFYKKYSVQSDVWSFGCVMYEIWSLGYKPFEDLDTTEYIKKITTGYRLPPPPGCPRAIYELMIKCWHPVANQRINSCLIFKALQQSDRALLPGTISAKDNEELSTGLGDPLTTSSHLYQDLQNTYLSTINS